MRKQKIGSTLDFLNETPEKLAEEFSSEFGQYDEWVGGQPLVELLKKVESRGFLKGVAWERRKHESEAKAPSA